MDSKKVKSKMLFELLYRLGYHMAVTEKAMYHGIADVFALTKAGYTHEIEVKISKADLKTELDCIDLAMSGKRQEKAMSKFPKHLAYLKNRNASKYTLFDPAEEDKRSFYFREPNIDDLPNKFSFAVTPDLVEYAKEKIKDTPYGLFLVHESFVRVVKSADHIHKQKITDKEKMYLLRKVSMEIEILRRKVAYGE